MRDRVMVKFLFFAQCADWMKTRELEISFSRPTLLIDFLKEDQRFLTIKEKSSFLKVAINQELSSFQSEVRDGDEIAFMPPYSGG